jgi:hypothetical protein
MRGHIYNSFAGGIIVQVVLQKPYIPVISCSNLIKGIPLKNMM